MNKIKQRILYGVLGVSLAGGMYALGRVTTPKEEPIDSNQTSISTDDELIDKYLTDLSTKREELEKEIENLKSEREKLQETKDNTEELSDQEKKVQKIEELSEYREEHKEIKNFKVSDLIVVETDLGESSNNLYILCPTEEENIYVEYHDIFYACSSSHEEYYNHYENKNGEIDGEETTKDKKIYQHLSNYIHFIDYKPLMSYMDNYDVEYIENSNGILNTLELDEYLKRIRSEYKKKNITRP